MTRNIVCVYFFNIGLVPTLGRSSQSLSKSRLSSKRDLNLRYNKINKYYIPERVKVRNVTFWTMIIIFLRVTFLSFTLSGM